MARKTKRRKITPREGNDESERKTGRERRGKRITDKITKNRDELEKDRKSKERRKETKS